MSPRRQSLRSVQLERWLAAPPEGVWRALTESRLLQRWLMENDFQPRVGHRFTLRAAPLPHWNGIADCEVLLLAPPQQLMHSWNASAEEAARGPRTVLTYTLTRANDGTRLQVTQSGFRIEEDGRRHAAEQHWPRFLDRLEAVVAGLAEDERSLHAQRTAQGTPGTSSSAGGA